MKNYTTEQVLPHRPPMILIDRLCHYTQEQAKCEVIITEQSQFYDHQRQAVPSYIGVEYMAQAIAAFAGADALDSGFDVQIGYLLGSRKYQPSIPWFELGAVLHIDVERLHEESSGLKVFQCQISIDQQTIVDAKINVFLPSQVNQGSTA